MKMKLRLCYWLIPLSFVRSYKQRVQKSNKRAGYRTMSFGDNLMRSMKIPLILIK